MIPASAPSTGNSRRPSWRTVSSVKRSPTCSPISANASSRTTGGTTKLDAGERQRAGDDHRAEQRAGGDVGAAGEERRDRCDGGGDQPVARRRQRVLVRHRADPLAAAEDRHQQRRREDDDQHAQVLHEGDEPIVAAEVFGHADDPGRAAGDHPERRRRAGRARSSGASTQPARDAERERARADQQDRQPRAGDRLQRVGLEVGAERDAAHGLGGDERASSGA